MPTYNIKRNGWKNLHKNTRSTGSCYERKAADYLKQQGLFILRYNYRFKYKEEHRGYWKGFVSGVIFLAAVFIVTTISGSAAQNTGKTIVPVIRWLQ